MQQNDAFPPPLVIKEHLDWPPRSPEVRVSLVPPCSRALGLDRLGTADKLNGADKLTEGSWHSSSRVPLQMALGLNQAWVTQTFVSIWEQNKHHHGSLFFCGIQISFEIWAAELWSISVGLQKCRLVQPCLNILFRKRCCNIRKGNPMCCSDISQLEPLPDLSELTIGGHNLSQTQPNNSVNLTSHMTAITSICLKQHRDGLTGSWKQLLDSATSGARIRPNRQVGTGFLEPASPRRRG